MASAGRRRLGARGWQHADASIILGATAGAVLLASFLVLIFVSVPYEPRSRMWWVAVASVFGFDAIMLGFAALISSRRLGWGGLWGYWVDRGPDEVVSAVRRGLAEAGFPVVPTSRRPTRRLLGKVSIAFELPGGAVLWIARPVGRGQLLGPVTRVAIDGGERMPPGDLERVKAAIAGALSG